MNYREIIRGTFLRRPNRFIAHVLYQDQELVAHVPNTGRCQEILLPGATVFLEKAANPNRKTAYSLLAAQKGSRLINIDSQAPNQVVAEALASGKLLGEVPQTIQREVRFGSSRLDFAYTLANGQKGFLEVKGVTLEQENIAYFPDAPTLRGVRHLQELMAASQAGYACLAVFVIQMQGVAAFAPNDQTHPQFGETLRQAQAQGVIIQAWDCLVQPAALVLHQQVPLRL